MIDTELLKEKVLDLAMRGKLVEQDPTEGNARQLLEDIKLERERLIKEKKIKKNKPLPEIAKEEIPYEIPESWEWVRLEELSELSPNSIADGPFGSNLKSIHYTMKKEVRIIQLSNVSKEGWRDENTKYTTFEHLENIKRSRVEARNIVITKMMPAGVAMVVPELEKEYVLSSDVIKFVPYKKINPSFLVHFINGPLFQKQVESELQGSTRKRTSVKKIKKYIVPLPTLGEQERILNKITLLFKLIDHLADQQDKFINYQKLIQDKALELAMQGKLVPQLPEEGTAANLLEEVEAERQRLIDEKKIKKTKPLLPIIEEEIPYEIPESWEWVRLGDIIQIINGDRGKNYPGRKYYVSEGCPIITASNLGEDFVDLNNLNFITAERKKKLLSGHVKKGDILYCIRGSLGKNSMCQLNEGVIASSLVVIRLICRNLSNNYIHLYLNSSVCQTMIERYKNGTAQPNLSAKNLSLFLFPLPPAKEQKRIVNKLDEINKVICIES